MTTAALRLHHFALAPLAPSARPCSGLCGDHRRLRRPLATAAAAAAAGGGGGGGTAAAPERAASSSSSQPPRAAAPSNNNSKQTGALQGVPVVSPPEELLVSALKRASRVGPSPTATRSGGGEAAKERSRSARQLDALMKELSVPLGRYVSGFPPPPYHLIDDGGGEEAGGRRAAAAAAGGGGGGGAGGPFSSPPAAAPKRTGPSSQHQLHPFDAALLDLTVAGGARGYAASLKRVDGLRKSLQQTGKAFAGRASTAPNAAAAKALLEEGTAELSRLFQKGSGCVRDLGAAARRLRRLPQVDPRLPTVALVGAPNVGKSSLVRALSSGAPTVCDYPFTTRSVALGHFFAPAVLLEDEDEDEGEYEEESGDFGGGDEQRRRQRQQQQRRRRQQQLRRHQVTDTPGLLDREDPERNAMERLTLACVAHLPQAAVLFVADLTEGCGASVAQQWRVRRRLREAFPTRAWVDVISKGDLLEPWNEEEEEEEDGTEDGAEASCSSPLGARCAAAERAVEAAEAPVGQRGGAREYERAVRLALKYRLCAESGRQGDHGFGHSPSLAPPLAVVRVSTVGEDGERSLEGLKRAVLSAIAWAERQAMRSEAREAEQEEA